MRAHNGSDAIMVRRARFFQARPRCIEIKTSQLFRMPRAHVTKFPSCNGERSWWLLSNDKRLRSATARALWKKGENSAPSVFHAFLGAICERPLRRLFLSARERNSLTWMEIYWQRGLHRMQSVRRQLGRESLQYYHLWTKRHRENFGDIIMPRP